MLIHYIHLITLCDHCKKLISISKVEMFTIIGRRKIAIPLSVFPTDYLHMVRNKRRYVALEDSSVTLYHKYIIHLRLIILVHNCKNKPVSPSVIKRNQGFCVQQPGKNVSWQDAVNKIEFKIRRVTKKKLRATFLLP